MKKLQKEKKLKQKRDFFFCDFLNFDEIFMSSFASNLIGDRFLTLEDDYFVLTVDSDIRHFVENCSENR